MSWNDHLSNLARRLDASRRRFRRPSLEILEDRVTPTFGSPLVSSLTLTYEGTNSSGGNTRITTLSQFNDAYTKFPDRARTEVNNFIESGDFKGSNIGMFVEAQPSGTFSGQVQSGSGGFVQFVSVSGQVDNTSGSGTASREFPLAKASQTVSFNVAHPSIVDLSIRPLSVADEARIGDGIRSETLIDEQRIVVNIAPGQALFFRLDHRSDGERLSPNASGGLHSYLKYTETLPTGWTRTVFDPSGSKLPPNASILTFGETFLGSTFALREALTFQVRAPFDAVPGSKATFQFEAKAIGLSDFLGSDVIEIQFVVPIQQDLQVRRDFDGEALVGINVVEAAPSAVQTVQLTALPNATSKFEVRFVNNGAAQTFNIRREETGTAGFQVNYFFQNNDVTKAVNAGTFVTPSIGTGQAVNLQVQILAPANLAGNANRNVVLQAFQNTTATTPLDAVRIVASTDLIVNTAKDVEDNDFNDGIDSDPNTPGLQLSLRDAIKLANQLPGQQRILFNIPTTPSIVLESPLPSVTESVVIDAKTQPGGKVELRGQDRPDEPGLHLASGSNGSTIQGFRIGGFLGGGILIESNNNVIRNNVLGMPGHRNSSGVVIRNGQFNALRNNAIADNLDAGIEIVGKASNFNDVLDNGIGLREDDTLQVDGQQVGVLIEDASNTVLRGNLILAHQSSGVEIRGAAARSNALVDNIIGNRGLDDSKAGNRGNGVTIHGGASGTVVGAPGDGNDISGNKGAGIEIRDRASRETTIFANQILKNEGGGIKVIDATETSIGEATDAAGQDRGNRIAGNNLFGILLESSDPTILDKHTVKGNLIGQAGDPVFPPNKGPGILIVGSSGNLIGGGNGDIVSGRSREGNVIGGNRDGENLVPGIRLRNGASFNRIQGNLIGFAPDGESAAPNGGIGIAIDTGASRNIIGQERVNGVVTGSGNRIGNNPKVQGNTDASGIGMVIFGETAVHNEVRGNILGSLGSVGPVSNDDFGIVVNAALFTVIDDNLFNRNGAAGILIAATRAPEEGVNTVVTRNRIGLGVEGAFRSQFGIMIDNASQNRIGGIGPFDLRGSGVGHPDGNIIQATTFAGILIDGGTGEATENLLGGNFISDAGVGVAIRNASENVLIGNRITANQHFGVEIDERANRILIGNTNQPNLNQPGHNVIAQNGVGVVVREPNEIGILGNNFFGNGTDIRHDAAEGVTPPPVIANVFSSTQFEFTSIEGQVVGNAGQEHLLQFYVLNALSNGPDRLQFLGQRRFTPNGENGGRYRFVLNRAVNPLFAVVATSSLITQSAGGAIEQFNTSPFSAPANIDLFFDDGDGIPDAIEEQLAPGTANDPATVTVPIFPPDNPVAEVQELPALRITAGSAGSSFSDVEVLKTGVLGNLPPNVNIFAAMQLKQVNIAGIGRFEIELPANTAGELLVRKLILLNPPVRDDGTLNFEIFDENDSPFGISIERFFFEVITGKTLERVRIDVVDGGPGDRDGEVNGIIVDPVVFFTAPETDLTTSVIAPATVAVGVNSVVTVRVTNTGLDLADRVRSRLTLPVGFDFVSASGGGTFDPATRTVTFVIGDVDAGAVVDRTVTVRATNVGTGTFQGKVLPQGFIGDANVANNSAEIGVSMINLPGTVTVQQVGSELRVIGDANSNDITLSLNQGTVVLSSSNSVLNTSAVPLTFTGITRVVVDAGAGDDEVSINGNLGPNTTVTLNGGIGTDRVISASNGNQTLTNTRLIAQQTIDLTGFEQATLQGGAGNNRLDASGFSGSVILDGGPGDDTLIGGSRNDIFLGGDGLDTVIQVANVNMTLSNTQLTGRGTDVLNSIERVLLTGSAGNNTFTLNGFTGQATVQGAGGRDTLVVIHNGNMVLTNTQLSTNAGARVQLVSIEAARLTGGAGNNRLDASRTSRPVTLQGLGGNDLLLGGSGNDLLQGGPGNDTLRGNAGNDRLDGGPGRNVLDGGPGQDGILLLGTAGDDVIRIQRLANQMVRIEFNGRIWISQYFGETVFVYGGAGNDHIEMLPGVGEPWQAAFYGQGGNDTLIGATARDVLEGGPGEDVIYRKDSLTDTIFADLANRLRSYQELDRLFDLIRSRF